MNPTKSAAVQVRMAVFRSVVLTLIALSSPQFPANAQTAPASLQAQFDEAERNPVAHAKEWTNTIAVISPDNRAEISGKVTITFRAPGMSHARASCWQQPTSKNQIRWGHDTVIDPDIRLDALGQGAFVFPSDQYPHGPLNLCIHVKDEAKRQDICQLQLYNKGGVKWNQGIPKENPPAARGLALAFADDFDGPLSISHDGKGARYQSHKTGGGDFSGWGFGNFEDATNKTQPESRRRTSASPVEFRCSTWLASHPGPPPSIPMAS